MTAVTLGATVVQGRGVTSPGSSSLCTSGCFTFLWCPGVGDCTHISHGPALRLHHPAHRCNISPRKYLHPWCDNRPEFSSKLQCLSTEWDIPGGWACSGTTGCPGEGNGLTSDFTEPQNRGDWKGPLESSRHFWSDLSHAQR